MACNCCGNRLNSGMIHKKDPVTGKKFKSCPHCSAANENEHVFHPYPGTFGKTPARVTAKNPDGDQSYCNDCRRLDKGELSHTYKKGKSCQTLV
ncbi:MAG: hypothetical protein ACI9LM_004421 [Alteromonadaceae bacterium]|jgi:hypothetical protein